DIGYCRAAGQCEVVVLWLVVVRAGVASEANALANQKGPDRDGLDPKPGPPPPRKIAAMPGNPVDKKQDMPRLLLHDRLEAVDQFRREEARSFRQREQAEGKETVDTLAEPGDHECPFGTPGAQVGRLGRQLNPVGLDQVRQDLLVTALFETIEIDRFLQ